MNLGLEYLTVEPKYIKVRIYDLGIEGGAVVASTKVTEKKLEGKELENFISKNKIKDDKENRGIIALAVKRYNYDQRANARKAAIKKFKDNYDTNIQRLNLQIKQLDDPTFWLVKLLKKWWGSKEFEIKIKELKEDFKKLLSNLECRVRQIEATGSKGGKVCKGFDDKKVKTEIEVLTKKINVMLSNKKNKKGKIKELDILKNLTDDAVKRWEAGIADKKVFDKIQEEKKGWSRPTTSNALFKIVMKKLNAHKSWTL